jgi:hypothetical protein
LKNRKNQNSILFLTTLGVLFLVAGAFAQPPEDKAEQDKHGVFINKRPTREFADSTVDQIQSGKINLEAPFRVVVSGKLAAKNKSIVLTDAKIEPVTQPENSDPAMVKLTQDGIMAISDAGWFGYIHNLGSKKVVITVEQTVDNFSASIRADQPSESQARTAASGLQMMTSIGKDQAKGDEKIILSAMTITSETDNIVIGLSLPKTEFHELIKRKIADSKTVNSKVSGN